MWLVGTGVGRRRLARRAPRGVPRAARRRERERRGAVPRRRGAASRRRLRQEWPRGGPDPGPETGDSWAGILCTRAQRFQNAPHHRGRLGRREGAASSSGRRSAQARSAVVVASVPRAPGPRSCGGGAPKRVAARLARRARAAATGSESATVRWNGQLATRRSASLRRRKAPPAHAREAEPRIGAGRPKRNPNGRPARPGDRTCPARRSDLRTEIAHAHRDRRCRLGRKTEPPRLRR